ncbi:GntR family transcriptional regulator [Marinovum sp.]|uniref:GntR family transcriptional regulator n=1 Tax=Marinovum sp. TaxID=2024839 RepID=UPI002B278232|nr:GntR family transcriptional regulator [Marinovum sp.]
MQTSLTSDRRTAVDEIFDHLHDEINALRLRPGDRISEAEIAARFGVSRQPVRDAFTRLANLDLLLIRPQRATEVRRFSAREIEKSRFVRAAVEAEVLRRAALSPDAGKPARLGRELDRQRAALAARDATAFSALDYDFHQALCEIAGAGFAFEVISSEKAKLDRLCLLGLAKHDRMPQLLADHEAIARAILAGDPALAVEAGMHHLSQLDSTLEQITKDNASYFEQDV